MNIKLLRINTTSFIDKICAQITPINWGKDNEMTRYDEALLRKFLGDDKNLLLLAYDGDKIAGAALCYELPHPAKDGSSLYVHELDTHPDYRRQGIATQMMQELFKIAKDRGLYEVWLGTEQDNSAANALYKSLDPYEIEPTITYSYKVD